RMPPILPAPSPSTRLWERGFLIGRVFLGRSAIRSITDPIRIGVAAKTLSEGPLLGLPLRSGPPGGFALLFADAVFRAAPAARDISECYRIRTQREKLEWHADRHSVRQAITCRRPPDLSGRLGSQRTGFKRNSAHRLLLPRQVRAHARRVQQRGQQGHSFGQARPRA